MNHLMHKHPRTPVARAKCRRALKMEKMTREVIEIEARVKALRADLRTL